jgi:uncharacterized membrane protein YbhN (UPF0104 family)
LGLLKDLDKRLQAQHIGLQATDAAVATLAYRLVSFWLPIPIGGLAYAGFRRRYP